MSAATADLIAALSQELGPEAVLSKAAVAARAAGIWRNDKVAAPVIFRPATTAEVALILAKCNAAGQSVVTHGGLTGLAGGAIATAADVVLSTERLNAIEKLDTINRTLCAQAGVRLQTAQDAAAAEGLMVALDLGARGSCTLGGNAATNAGGNRVLRYGMTREQILGIEAVLADGTVVSSLQGMLKNNAGYDLRHLFIGTEGTLGVITRLVLRLRPLWRTQETALLACNDFGQVTQLLAWLDESLGGTLSAFELMWRSYYQLVSASRPPLPQNFPYYVLVEALGGCPDGDAERFLNAVEAAAGQGLLADAVICKSGIERDALWAMRDDVEQTLQFGPAAIFDVSLSLADMETYVTEVLSRLDGEWQSAHQTWVFGHAGDGNLHFVVAAGDGGAAGVERIERCIYEPLLPYAGSVSGEHGIGLEKKHWLSASRSAAELSVMRALKNTFDPRNILNPGRIFDPVSPAVPPHES